ncbi:hypothetical protein SDC9_107344 [bioreactor metagenome]|uniref:NAD-specific glutamate dehydrogenase n=1 Tax=bioreactor metagenome TaxID=1076179 RepID=A0A645BBD9_9ZZZZ
MDIHSGLAVLCGGEDLRLADGDGGVALNDLGHDRAHGLHTQRKRGDVEQEDVFDFAAQHAALDGCTNGNHFVGVDAFVRLFVDQLADQVHHLRHTAGTTYQNQFIDLGSAQTSIFKGTFKRFLAAIQKGSGHLLKFGAAQFHLQVFRAAGIGGDVRQVELGFHNGRKLDLGLFGSFTQTL